jgi:hypothetical protein
VKKPCFEGIGVKNRGFLAFGTYGKFNICSILNFPKITKNDVKIELLKSQKTHSDSKTDLNVRFKVRNAGPYLIAR